MSRPFFWMAVALAAAPAVAWLVYRLARGLGFLDPPADLQHELRRTIVVAVYSFLLFLPVLIYGFEKRWPGAWIIFGIVDGLALAFFAVSGVLSAIRLWKLRHGGSLAVPAGPSPAGPADPAGFEVEHAGEHDPALADSAPHAEHAPAAAAAPDTFDPPVRS